MFAIVGSGFGLYGYLPAVCEAFGSPVLLPEAYRPKFEARPELAPYAASIRWVADTQAALARARTVVIATPPARQVEVARRCAAIAGVESLVLEKPLAPDPAAAAALLAHLGDAGKRYRAGYTLLHTAWAGRLAWPRGAAAPAVAITWTFMAHHFAHGLDTWKRVHAEGGGPLRFFGVHLVALLASRGYVTVRESVLEGGTAGAPERWSAVYGGAGLPECRVAVDSRNCVPAFRIALPGSPVDLEEPYAGEGAAGAADRRIGVLKRVLATLSEPDARHAAFCDDVNRLWRATEEATTCR